METKPELFSLKDWNSLIYPKFVEMYGMTVYQWRDIMIEKGYRWNTVVESYELYKKWHNENYTKLGRALK